MIPTLVIIITRRVQPLIEILKLDLEVVPNMEVVMVGVIIKEEKSPTRIHMLVE